MQDRYYCTARYTVYDDDGEPCAVYFNAERAHESAGTIGTVHRTFGPPVYTDKERLLNDKEGINV